MSIIIESGNSVHFTCSARLIDDDRDVVLDCLSAHQDQQVHQVGLWVDMLKLDNANRNRIDSQ